MSPNRSSTESVRNIDECRLDELRERCVVDLTTGRELHVSPTPTRAFEEVGRVWQQGAKEEADVDVFGEDVDVSKRSVADARGRMSVVHELADVVATSPHAGEPVIASGRKSSRCAFSHASMAGSCLTADGSRNKSSNLDLIGN